MLGNSRLFRNAEGARQYGMSSEVIMAVALSMAAKAAEQRAQMFPEDRKDLYRALSLVFSEMEDAAFEKGLLRLFDPTEEGSDEKGACGKNGDPTNASV